MNPKRTLHILPTNSFGSCSSVQSCSQSQSQSDDILTHPRKHLPVDCVRCWSCAGVDQYSQNLSRHPHNHFYIRMCSLPWLAAWVCVCCLQLCLITCHHDAEAGENILYQWWLLFVLICLNLILFPQWSYLGCQNSDSASSSKFHHLALLALLAALVLH